MGETCLPFRLRIDKALGKWGKQTVQEYTFDLIESLYKQYSCFLDLIDGSLKDQIGEWVPTAIGSKVPFYIASNLLTEVNGGELKQC